MLSGADFFKNVNTDLKAYANMQSVNKKGEDNLVVDGTGISTILTEADETVILLDEGDDIVIANSNSNSINAYAGNNTILANGDKNEINAENGDNLIMVEVMRIALLLKMVTIEFQ